MLLIDLLVANASSKKHYPDLARASSVWNFCARTIGASLFQALRSWERRERKRHAKSCRGGKKEKGRERELLYPSFLPLYCLRFLYSADPTISEPGTGYIGPVHAYPDIFESETFSFQILKSPRPPISGYFLTRKFFFARTVLNIHGKELGSIL